MSYIIIFSIIIAIIISISLFVYNNIENKVFSLFFSFACIITTIISIYAIYKTHGKTIFIIWIPFLFYLCYSKFISFKYQKFEKIKTIRPIILIFIPLYILQYSLHFGFHYFTSIIPSDDILFYASISKNLLDFGYENYSGVLKELYPQLFSGISPYHYYELWLNAMIADIFHLSHVYTLLLVTYPILLFILLFGIVSIIELYMPINWYHYILTICLFFIGPLYFSFYETVFRDGNFFNSTVFTITGFTKQTLAFSYYGQKHLPVYIFSIISFYFLLQGKNLLFIFFTTTMCITSFGILPSIFSALGLLCIFVKRYRTWKNLSILFFQTTIILSLYYSFSQRIGDEITSKTFYLNDFLKYLTIKGEILRIVSKILSPMIWFSILYLPLVIILIIKREKLFQIKENKYLILIIIVAFLSGTFFISLIQGLNSDQFITNLLPIFNVFFIFILISLLNNGRKHVLVSLLLIGTCNYYYIFSFFNAQRCNIGRKYSVEYLKGVYTEIFKIKPDEKLAYLLTDSLINSIPPINWYTYRPGKFLIINNYSNFININYPFTIYPRNSSSIAFSPANQMRFYIRDSSISKNDFEKYQLTFLQQHNIRFIFAQNDKILPNIIKPFISKKYFDIKTKEILFVLKF